MSTCWNACGICGLAAALLLASADSALAEVHYVDVNSTNATPPNTSWFTAATNIQDAVDAAAAGDEIVVTNGIYYRVVVNKPLNVRSVNGSEATIIDGVGSGTCVSLTDGASLSGFTLIHGNFFLGGGAFGGTLNNCTLTGNSAQSISDSDGAYGGGAAYCTLNNCTLTGNTAQLPHPQPGLGRAYGGGAAYCTLNNCVLTGNGADFGGGAYRCQMFNCTLTGNSATLGGGGAYQCQLGICIVYFNSSVFQGANSDAGLGGSTLRYCCTTPLPTIGVGNSTNAPLFVDFLGGNLRLQSNSPCINVGLNVLAPAGPDLDGNPRIVGGTVDMGAYEYQSLDMIGFGVVSNQFGFNLTGQSNWVIVLEASSDFTNWTPLATNTLGASPFSFRDPTPPNLPQSFYRARQW
jgi:hypothetical protein